MERGARGPSPAGGEPGFDGIRIGEFASPGGLTLGHFWHREFGGG